MRGETPGAHQIACGISKILPVTGAELHRATPGKVSDWRRGPSHRHVITLSGRGEVEVAGGKKIAVGPGSIDLIEDTTGKGLITRETGTEDRIALHLLIADPPAASLPIPPRESS